ncbi:KN motif and ankyrin repeat domain-containing protein 2-like isoform X9 [Haliotis rufescens]|uniref:KN motif and ankyrin repeat domain-containing protein 2-like isoform X9 n=1 Tax=Haliotis rufescens TaxID=6454 RepID=UPI00201E90DF|nr:KN motif and ankyrin repeat domain-containing protein 2-like isoform X9 [Haliotis rufescens]
MMELTRVVLVSLVLLCGVRDAHAVKNVARKLKLMHNEIKALKRTIVDLETEMSDNFELLESSLKEELTDTFLPALIKPLVKQAITDILKEKYIENIISGRVLEVVKSLKASIYTTKTQFQSVKREIRQVKRERDSYKDSLDRLRGELTKDTHRDFQGIQQRIQELEDRDALREKQIQDLTEQIQKASSDRSHGERAEQMTTVTTHASSDPSRTTRTPVTTTKKPATQATPSPADCGDLYDASRRGNLEEVKRILSQGVDVNCRSGWWSRTPVMGAAWSGNRDVVELLVSEGADVSLVDRDGHNILHFACVRGHFETVKFVLSLHVVDIDARDNWRRTAADWARDGGHTRVVDLLESRGAQ